MLTKEIIEKKYPGKKLEKIKYLNLWGEDLENVDIIAQMKSLKVISLSANKISSLKPFEKLENLKELYIRNNNISNIDEIDYLKDKANLKSLWMSDNPVSKNEKEFRKAIIEKLPNLATLDNTPIPEIKKDVENKKDMNDKDKTIEFKNEKDNDIVIQGTEGEIIDNTDNNDNKVDTNKDSDKKDEDNKNNKVTEENIEKTEEDNIFDDLIGDDLKDKKEEKEKPKENQINELKQTKNRLLVSTVDKLSDLLQEFDKDHTINTNNEDKSNQNPNDKSNFLGSKSDIFKTGYSFNKNNKTTKKLDKEMVTPPENNEKKETKPDVNENKDKVENNNNLDKDQNKDKDKDKEDNDPLKVSFKEQNNELVNDILKDVDTSQTFIRKTNTNKTIKINPNVTNTNDDNVSETTHITNEKDNNSFTKNLNDMIKNSNMNVTSQSFRIGGNTGLNNILSDIHTSQTMVKKNNDNSMSKILGNVNTSQTMKKRKDQQVKDILRDVETTTTNFNKITNKMNNIEKNNNQNLQSIDDIRKIFNNDYPSSNINNLYGNNNVKDTRINNIFKNEFISSDSMSNSKQKGPYKLEYNNNINNMMNKKNEYEYGAPSGNNNNGKKGGNNDFNLNPNHMHKINAIIHLLEDLNLENLIHVKNQIMKMVNQ